MIDAGEIAPDFSLEDSQGNEVTLSDCLVDGDLVLYFYPADFSPVCTAEACAFRDKYDDLADVGTRIVGISPQGKASHARFVSRYSIPFPILSDPRKTAIRAYGVNGPLGMGVRRATFLIGQDGKVKQRVVSDLSVLSHSDMIRKIIRQAG